MIDIEELKKDATELVEAGEEFVGIVHSFHSKHALDTDEAKELIKYDLELRNIFDRMQIIGSHFGG